MEESIANSFLLELLQFNNRRYSIGLFNKEGLVVKEEWIRSTIEREHSSRNIEFNMKTKEVKAEVVKGGGMISKDTVGCTNFLKQAQNNCGKSF